MGSDQVTTDVLIVGAGLAGLMAANELASRGVQVLVLDKGKNVGGRMATRRIGGGRADHGAQFFTVRTPEFQVWVDRWLEAGLVFQWATGWSDGSLHRAPTNGHPRYAVHHGMASLARHLAADLDVRLEVEARRAAHQEGSWLVTAADGSTFTGRALLLATPVPQALALLTEVNGTLSLDDRAALSSITYAPCLTGLFWVEGSLYLPAPGAIQRPDMPITWIADNQRKGISPEACILTVQAGPEVSRRLWDVPDDQALLHLEQVFAFFLGPEAVIRDAQLKRWRYAMPEKVYPERYLMAECATPLVFAGDAFGGPRVEGAVLSGLAAASALLDRLASGGD
jgi:predicted NAD/FAD-dependent oxidoreductase